MLVRELPGHPGFEIHPEELARDLVALHALRKSVPLAPDTDGIHDDDACNSGNDEDDTRDENGCDQKTAS